MRKVSRQSSVVRCQLLKSFGLSSNAIKIFLTLFVIFCGCLSAQAQRRDHLTEPEADIIREAQELDLRTGVFVKAVERRMTILNGGALSQKEIEKYGEPKGTKAQLLYDISKILLSAIDNVEYVAEKDAKNPLFGKSVHMLADASRKFLPQLEKYKAQMAEKMEQAAILTSIDYCQQIIEASAKVPKEVPKEEKKKKSKDDSN